MDNENNEMDCVSVADFQKVVQYLFNRIQLLEDLVENGLIGGVKSLYDTHTRETGISSLKSKYGSKFDPLSDALSGLGIPDWATTLFDELGKVKGNTPDWDDEKESKYVDDGLSQLMARISKITGKPVEANVVSVEGEVPSEETVVTTEEAPEEEDTKPSDNLVAALNKMKNGSKKAF